MVDYEVLKDEKSERGYYTRLIKWKPPIRSGYIVQYVEIIDPLHIIPNYERPYYEAWKVKDGKTQYAIYDDEFSNEEAGLLRDDAINQIQQKIDSAGFIEYKTKSIWVDIENPVYNQIAKWKSGISMARDLPSTYEPPENLMFEDEYEIYRVTFKKTL